MLAREVVKSLRQRLPGDFTVARLNSEHAVAVMGAATKIVFALEDDEELDEREEFLRGVCIHYGADYAVARSPSDLETALQFWGLA